MSQSRKVNMRKKEFAIVVLISGVFLLSLLTVLQVGPSKVYASNPNIAPSSNATLISGGYPPAVPTAGPVTKRTKMVGGLQALKPSQAVTSSSPFAFTEADAKQYATANFGKVGKYYSVKLPVVVDKVQFMTVQDKNVWYKGIRGWVNDNGDPDNGLVCVTILDGAFSIHGGPPSITTPSQEELANPITFKHGYLILDAQSGNYLGEGIYN